MKKLSKEIFKSFFYLLGQELRKTEQSIFKFSEVTRSINTELSPLAKIKVVGAQKMDILSKGSKTSTGDRSITFLFSYTLHI